MMGFGPMVSGAGGNSSSSTSNLSALAPPFTVHKSNAKPNSNANLHYHESPYTAEPYSHCWEYSSPSAPVVLEPSGNSNVPLPDSCQFSATTTLGPTITHCSTFSSGNRGSLPSSFAYGGEVKPYYSPYVTPLVGEVSQLPEADGFRYNKGPKSGGSFEAQIDYTRGMWDVDYDEAEWTGNSGLDNGKRVKRVDREGGLIEKPNLGGLYSFGSQLHQGGPSAEKNKEVSKESFSGISNQIFNRVPIKSIPAAYTLTHHKSHHSIPSSELNKSFSDDQNSSTKCVKPVDKPFIGPVSAIMASPTVVIRPPPSNNGYIKQSTLARKPTQCDNVESVQSVKFSPVPNSQFKEGTSQTSLFDIPDQGNFSVLPKELSTPLQSRDSLDRKCKAGFGSQSLDVSNHGGFNIACGNNVQVLKSSENSLEFVVDSPCWKGASCSSQFSTFDIEAGNSNNFKNNMDEYNGSNNGAHQQNLDLVINFSQGFPGKSGEGNSNNGKNELDSHCSSKYYGLLGDAKCRGWIAKENETINEPNLLGKQSVLANVLTGGSDERISNAKHLTNEVEVTTLNDVSEGVNVAVHAAEKVLASPASQEDANERIKEVDRKLLVPTVLKAMHNLSELLMLHVSSESCFLEKESTETLENIISNLNSCMQNKFTEAGRKLELNNSAGDRPCKLWESRNVGTVLGSHTINEALFSDFKLDRQLRHDHEGNNNLSVKKDDKSPILSSLMDDLDITSDDNMTKAIKKVLDENFQLNEEIHSEAVLFKNLWLDAEAKLCSISYKARFDRMKIQMGRIRLKGSQDNEDSEVSEVCVSPEGITASEVGLKGHHDGPIPKPILQNVPISCTGEPADSLEASVMARFNILKSREESAKPMHMEGLQKPDKSVDGEHVDPIVARFNIFKSIADRSGKSINMENENQRSNKMNNACKNLDEFHLMFANDQRVHSFRNNLGTRDSLPSDWEHVMKDDFSWRIS
ncbi:cysteine-rich RLK (RECEPTOR-like protein kinase)8 [Striga asiatica]|uniref:Cysteine-rich RLK (RECEPTOR-like protein kinase)8 n=1 Tax=Striga asiatica TaxID=4170 RepID=A0A5A7PLE6_STRAF|nr:cysteine-rich RLK (RECEPTOR-like protein kinase)8 [Striga asiatica]